MDNLVLPLVKGFAFGITMAMIPGPIFFLIIQRTLNEGALIGILCGLGAASADMVFAGIAAVGLSFLIQGLFAHQSIVTFVGGLFLIYLGAKTFMRVVKQSSTGAPVAKKGYINAWLSTFLLTLTNPVTIVSYAIIFAGLGIGPENFAASLIFIAGVVVGAMTVVFGLVGFFSNFHGRLSSSLLTKINRAAGVLLMCFGIAALARALHII